MSSLPFESDYIKTVNSFSELTTTLFEGKNNALCWQRNLDGDFQEMVSQLILENDITEVSAEDLEFLNLSENGNKARQIILNDMKLLTEFGALPSLNLLKCYERDDELGFISTDVYSWHVDRSPIGTDTYLCTYHGASSDILPNDEAVQKIVVPEIREALKKLYNGPENEFETFLVDHFFDLHYQEKPHAKAINVGKYALWRLAVDHPDQAVLPSIHRAPKENEGEYRLMLIC